MKIHDFRSQASVAFAIMLLTVSVAFLPPAARAAQQQQNPAPQPSDHSQHHHGGFMQDGMHHATAKGIKLDQQVDTANHTITLREGPITLQANTDHMKM